MGTIVIVEDNEIICDSLKNIVNSVDDSQAVFGTGYAAIALEYAKNHEVDVFMLDIELLDYSGITLAEEIRSLDGYEMTPIVFVTGDAKLELEAYRNSHCYQFITKPFETEEVKEIIKIIMKHGIIESKKDEKLSLNQKGYTISILQKDIIYIEARNRKLMAITQNEELEIASQTLVGILEELTSDFFRCHKGFIINSDWIYRVDWVDQVIHLRDNSGAIPYGRRYKERLQANGCDISGF